MTTSIYRFAIVRPKFWIFRFTLNGRAREMGGGPSLPVKQAYALMGSAFVPKVMVFDKLVPRHGMNAHISCTRANPHPPRWVRISGGRFERHAPA